MPAKSTPVWLFAKIPLEPEVAVIVPVLVRMFVAAAPMFLPAAVDVVRLMVPVPTLSNVAAVCVMSPPVALPPVLVATVSVPPCRS